MSFRCRSRGRARAALMVGLMLLMPAAVAAQWGVSMSRTQSLIRWDYGGCGDGFCPSYAQSAAPRTSVSTGVTYDVSILSWLALRGEGRLVMKGYTVTGPRLDLSYLELPVLARFELPVHTAWLTPFVVAGVAPAIKLDCTLESWGCQESTIGDRRIRPYDLSGVIGGGFEMRVNEHAFALDYRMAHGWRNIGYEAGNMRNILVSYIVVDYRHLSPPDRPDANPFVDGGVIGVARTLGNTCGIAHQPTGIAGELHARPFAGDSWWASRLEGSATYFPDELSGSCTPARRSFGGSDARTMSGFATLGPAVVLERSLRTDGVAPYLHAGVGGFAARLDHASPGFGRVALGATFVASVGVKLRRRNRATGLEVRYQTLAPVLGQRVNIAGVGIGLMQ